MSKILEAKAEASHGLGEVFRLTSVGAEKRRRTEDEWAKRTDDGRRTTKDECKMTDEKWQIADSR